MTRFPSEDHTAVSAVATAAVLASAAEVDDGSAPPGHSDGVYTSQVLFAMTSSRSFLLGPARDGQHFAYL